MQIDKLLTRLQNKQLCVIFFHTSKKISDFKMYKVPKVNYLPFPSSAGSLFYSYCTFNDFSALLEQLSKDSTILAVWSGRDMSWVRLSEYSLFFKYSKLDILPFIGRNFFSFKN